MSFNGYYLCKNLFSYSGLRDEYMFIYLFLSKIYGHFTESLEVQRKSMEVRKNHSNRDKSWALISIVIFGLSNGPHITDQQEPEFLFNVDPKT